MRAALVVAMVLGCGGSPKAPPAQAPAEAKQEGTTDEPIALKTASPPEAPAGGEVESAGRPASGEQAKIAWQLNEDGKALVMASKYSEASAKFREAIARVPDPLYFYNLCTALFMEGKFAESLTACRAVGKHAPDAKLQTKTEKLIGRVHDEAKRQGVVLE